MSLDNISESFKRYFSGVLVSLKDAYDLRKLYYSLPEKIKFAECNIDLLKGKQLSHTEWNREENLHTYQAKLLEYTLLDLAIPKEYKLLTGKEIWQYE